MLISRSKRAISWCIAPITPIFSIFTPHHSFTKSSQDCSHLSAKPGAWQYWQQEARIVLLRKFYGDAPSARTPSQAKYITRLNVRYWHKADIPRLSSDVCFWGKADIVWTCSDVCFSNRPGGVK